MNYSAYNLEQILYTDFMATFEAEHPGVSWSAHVQPKINQMFKDVFIAAAAHDGQGMVPPPATNQRRLLGRCRAIYGADLMIDSQMNPVLLEMNFSPDCKRYLFFKHFLKIIAYLIVGWLFA